MQNDRQHDEYETAMQKLRRAYAINSILKWVLAAIESSHIAHISRLTYDVNHTKVWGLALERLNLDQRNLSEILDIGSRLNAIENVDISYPWTLLGEHLSKRKDVMNASQKVLIDLIRESHFNIPFWKALMDAGLSVPTITLQIVSGSEIPQPIIQLLSDSLRSNVLTVSTEASNL